MIQVFADDALVYDSRLEVYDLVSLKVTNGISIGGTASIVLPTGHPAYNLFTNMRTIVTVYRDGALRFRGRFLYPSDDFYGQRTITCEGERCLLRDGVTRPYVYQDSPSNIFADVIAQYNSQVDDFKKFRLGECTVEDPNGYIRLESSNAETNLDTVDKLIERCGGYLVFTTANDGARVVNWYASLNYQSRQVIELGENLLNYASSASATDLVTRVHAYGAKFGELRLSLGEINGGLDYIQDDEAVARWGVIARAVYWDDVTVRTNLMAKARAYLAEHLNVVTSLELSALDLSYLDKSIDSFAVGDSIRVISKPHDVDEYFQLAQMTEDLLDPSLSSISLGKDAQALTREDVKGDLKNQANMEAKVVEVLSDYKIDVANITTKQNDLAAAVADTQETQSSLIQQTSEAIITEVSRSYVTAEQLTEAVATKSSQFEDQFLFEFESMKATLDETDAENREQILEIYKYIRFDNGNITLGAGDSAITLTLENDLIVFKKNGAQFGWWDGVDFHTGNIVVEVNERAQFGNFAFVPRSNGSLSFLKVGG